MIDEKLSCDDCPDFEGKRCLVQHIKMPFMISDRSFISIFYEIEKPDGSFVSISSDKGAEAVVAAQAKVIKKNVVANNIMMYCRLTPTADGCDYVSV